MSDYEPKHDYDEEPVVGDAPPKAPVLLSNAWYDRLLPVARVWLPALALFYITLAPLWGLPKQEEVAGSIVALDLLLGTVLGISHRQYQKSDARFDGSINVRTDLEEGTSQLNVQLDPLAIMDKDEVTVRVNRA